MNDKIKQYMIDNGLSQRQMAQKLGVCESQLNRWVNGKVKPCVAWVRIIDSIIS
jgi:transcriptional regulator with XRE-family HTH domain